ncbi:MAG: vanw family protein [Acidobacteria bacterium]|nr:MAG: vanw family protein [Acidobacteriota bacterium]
MTANPELITERKIPTYADSIVFRFKTALLQVRRSLVDLRGRNVGRHRVDEKLANHPLIATSRTKLWTENEPQERFLVAGKIHNLRIAIEKLNGLEIPAGATFSFWKHVGRASGLRGFVEGRELREGCIIPNVGGGLCQISNALYDAALQAGHEIVERHAHTQVIAGSLAEQGRDATVFWNYVDLRFRSDSAFRIEAKLKSDELVVRFRGKSNGSRAVHQIVRSTQTADVNSCATCEVGDCHRVVDAATHADFGRAAFLVDEHSPEFDKYITSVRDSNDILLLPLDGRRFRKSNYAWKTTGFGKVRQSFFVTAKRSYRSRKLAAQGAARQKNLLRMYEELAESYAKLLTYDVTHVTVQQSLLPFLWKRGHLGGRTFDVLMSGLPMHEIQKRLDVAFELNPESKTLGDFRADKDLIDAERDALREARTIVTSHTEIASLFPNRSKLLDWNLPAVKESRSKPANEKPVIVFPASTVGRKGCYELREALAGIDTKIVILGPIIEGKNFWDGFEIERGREDWLQIADLVVLPAFIEHRPRRLLLAAANGIPVIASPECGVTGLSGVNTVDAGDAAGLRRAIIEQLDVLK